MNEPALIRAIARWTAAASGDGLIAGIGDDCAILRPRANEDLLVTTDLVVEDAHFTRATHTLPAIGAKCLARGLSDIAAMGGKPRFALLSLTLAPWTGASQLRAFYRGATALAAAYGVRIIGGDITRSQWFSADIIVIGAVPRGRALRRDTARPGDGIYVSGPLGRAAASNWKAAVEPRVGLGVELRRRRATACIDLSDGLALDLHRMMLASGHSAEINSTAIPLARGATLEQALHGGEDYELLYTLPANARRRPRPEFTLIGYVTKGPAGRVRLDGKPLPPRGWDPFRR
jgi:thiamine-monophosphate kinase